MGMVLDWPCLALEAQFLFKNVVNKPATKFGSRAFEDLWKYISIHFPSKYDFNIMFASCVRKRVN